MTSDPVHHAVAVPATTANLGPGFDAFGLALAAPVGGEIASLAVRSVPASLRDTRVTTAGEGADELATGDDNLVWRAFVAFCDRHEVAVPDVAIDVRNGIPLERGLGSSSAAIVAGLTLARAVTGTVVSDLDVVALATALEGHPDNVAPAVLGGLVACATDDAGELVVRRIDPGPTLRLVALVPTDRQATTSARAVLPASLPRAAVAEQAARAGHVLGALAGVWPAAAEVAGDLLHEPVRAIAMPGSGAVLGVLRDQLRLHAWLSGAGPTVAAAIGPARPGSPDRALDEVCAVGREHAFTCHELVADLAGAIACPDDGCAFAATGTCARCPRRRV